MKDTYEEAMARVFEDEGGYSNDPGDSGGPTNWGITIHDARHYWKADATANDVRHMPKSVAEEIYRKHYADPIHYDDLPAGVDYAVLDYGINSGISRAVRCLQTLVHAHVDGTIGDETIKDAAAVDPKKLVTDIYDSRLRFLMGLRIWRLFGKGWGRRVREGKAAALKMVDKYKAVSPATPKKGFFSGLFKTSNS